MEKIEEFWYCVSNQDELPIYKANEILENQSSDKLVEFIRVYKSRVDKNISFFDNNNEKILSDIIIENPSHINEIRKLVGISDKRLYLELSFIFNRYKLSNNKNIFEEKKTELKKHSTTFFINALSNNQHKQIISQVIAKYFIDKDILEMLGLFIVSNEENIKKLFEFLMEPKELQQKEAKYRGHGAEMFIAKTFMDCKQNIYPKQKASHPMETKDPNVNLSTMEIINKDTTNPFIHSFDMIIKDCNDNIRILVQSLIHSSDPGQYGVDKSNETITIKNLIDMYNKESNKPRVYLWGSLDGVGFIENPNGTIIKMLNHFDQFIQINTAFKIGLNLYKLGLCDNLKGIFIDKNFFEEEIYEHFKFMIIKSGLKFVEENELNLFNCVIAGKGILCF